MFLKIGTREISLRLIVVAAAGLTLVAVAVTVAVTVARGSADTVGGIVEVPASSDRFNWIGVEDFVVEDELARGTEPSWIAFRPRKERWTESDVEEHWIDPREIGVDVLGARVRESIRQRLEDVP